MATTTANFPTGLQSSPDSTSPAPASAQAPRPPSSLINSAKPTYVDEYSFYVDPEKQTRDLAQGDLLSRNSGLVGDVLSQYHPYFAAKTANEFFLVLTQSCDLVTGRAGTERCKARYIELAPVRSLKSLLDRQFEGEFIQTNEGERIGSENLRSRYEEFCKKIINNNEPRYFFLPQRNDLSMTEDMCAILSPSVAIRCEHYDRCLQARIGQLGEIFQAKLGWLTGQQYSRVGTPDWDPEAASVRARAFAMTVHQWIPERQFQGLKKKRKTLGTAPLTGALVEQWKAEIKDRRHQAVEAVVKTLLEQNVPIEEAKLRSQLAHALKDVVVP